MNRSEPRRSQSVRLPSLGGSLACALSALLFACNSALAGAKGFTAIFLEIGETDFYASKVFSVGFVEGFPDSKERRDCWSDRATGGKTFELIIKKALPEGLTNEVAKSIWDGDRKAARKAQQIMAKAVAPNHQEIDGLYVIDARGGRISVMALGTKAPLGPKNPSHKLTIPWNEDNPEQGAADFDLALCRVSRPLDYHFSP
jgi:hypothetical protein